MTNFLTKDGAGADDYQKATGTGTNLDPHILEHAATIAAGADVTEGNTTDAAIVTDTTGTVSGKLRGLIKWAFERMPASLGQKTSAASLPVVLPSDQTVPVSGTTAATVADGADVALGATSGAAVVTDTNGTLQQYLRGLVKLVAAKISIATVDTITTITNAVSVTGTFWQATQPTSIANGSDVAEGATTDAASATSTVEDTTARTGIGLFKGIKNALKLINDKLVSGTDIGDVTINNASGASAVNIQDGGNAITVDGTVAATVASGGIASGAVASGAIASGAVASGAVVDGAIVTLGATTDAAVITDTTGTLNGKVRGLVAHMATLLSRMPSALAANGGMKVEGVAGGVAQPVSGTFWQTTQPVSAASGQIASGAVASGAIAAGAMAAGSQVDGHSATLGAKADARSTATDTTAITMMQVLKQLSYMLQNPAALAAGTNGIGKLTANSGVDIGDVDVTSIAAGETHLGNVTGSGSSAHYTLTVTNGAYSIGDVVGGLITVANAARGNGGHAVVNSIKIASAVAVPYTVWFFNADTATATQADNAVFTLAAADQAKFLGSVDIALTDYRTPGSGTFAFATTKATGLQVKAGGATTSLLVYLVAGATTSPGTSSLDITIDMEYLD